METILIPHGVFLYGDNKVPTQVDHDFRISRYPTTVRQFREFVEATGYGSGDLNQGTCHQTHHLDCPVVCVNVEDANAYCEWVHGRLPTEIEWEYAVRGVDGRLYPWGEETPTDIHLQWSRMSKSCDLGIVSAHPAGASPFGVEDAVGNAWEWTSTKDGDKNVVRGGHREWNGVSRVRCAYRKSRGPEFRISAIGFRCAFDVSTR